MTLLISFKVEVRQTDKSVLMSSPIMHELQVQSRLFLKGVTFKANPYVFGQNSYSFYSNNFGINQP